MARASSPASLPVGGLSGRMRLGVASALALYVALAVVHIAWGTMNVDEGFYATAARAAWQGEVPYRDFGYTQTPLLPYINGAAMGLIGFGLFEQRAVNGLWALLALGLAARLIIRRGLPQRALFLVVWFALTPAWLYFIHLGKTYGCVSLVAMGAVTVLLEWAPGWKKSVALALLGTIGVGCRLPSAPFFGVLWLAAWWDRDGFSGRRAGYASLALVGAVGGLLLPFYLAAPEQARFWAVDFFRISVPLRKFHVRWEEVVALSPTLWVLAMGVALAGIHRRRSWPRAESAVAVAALLALGFNLLPQGAYDEYGVPFLLPLAVALLLLARPVAGSAGRRVALAGFLLLAPLAVIPALYWKYREPAQRQSLSTWLPLSGTPYNPDLPGELREAREFVVKTLPPGEPFYGPAVILGVEAGRPIPRRLRMGAFAITSDYPAAQADRLHLMTYDELSALFSGPGVKLIGMHGQLFFNYAWSMPSFRYQTTEERIRWSQGFASQYDFGVRNPEFLVMVRR